jgi:uncharacterized membrane protein YsdA (DUF1294 family)
MKELLQFATYYLPGINALSFLLFALDKGFAKRKKWRIPEATLLLVSALFGSLGALLAMLIFRHKTNAKRHPAFAIGVPVMLIVQAALVYWLLRSCQLVP